MTRDEVRAAPGASWRCRLLLENGRRLDDRRCRDRIGSRLKEIPVKRLGLIVNPLAGIGGRVAFKGSDGADIVERALALGAVPLAPSRAVDALKKLLPLRDDFELMTYSGSMGADEAEQCGFAPTVVGRTEEAARTTADDTRRAADALSREKVDLLLFAGGDGTARDVYDVVGQKTPVLGIPAGVRSTRPSTRRIRRRRGSWPACSSKAGSSAPKSSKSWTSTKMPFERAK